MIETEASASLSQIPVDQLLRVLLICLIPLISASSPVIVVRSFLFKKPFGFFLLVFRIDNNHLIVFLSLALWPSFIIICNIWRIQIWISRSRVAGGRVSKLLLRLFHYLIDIIIATFKLIFSLRCITLSLFERLFFGLHSIFGL